MLKSIDREVGFPTLLNVRLYRGRLNINNFNSHLQESENQYLPQQICSNCYCQLQNAYQFKEQYILSIELLCEFLTSNNDPSTHSTERDSIISIRDKLRSTSKISQPNTTKVEKSIKNELKFEEVMEDIGVDCVEEDQYSDTDVKPDWGNEDSPDNSNDIPDIKNDSLKPGLDDLNESEELEEGEIEFETDSNSNQKSLADILRQKYKIYDLTCNVCNKELSTRATLLRHMDTHNKTRIFKHRCHICNKGQYLSTLRTASTLCKQFRLISNRNLQGDERTRAFYRECNSLRFGWLQN